MAVAQKIVQLHALSEGDALAWLQAQGTIHITGLELGRRWGWHRNDVGRQLQSWAATGAIQRKGKTITALSAPPQNAKVQNAKPVKSAIGQSLQSSAIPLQTAKMQKPSLLRKLLSCLMILAALCIIGVLVYINYVSWGALSESAPNVGALRVLSVVLDALVVILPAAARIARWWTAMLIWAIWAVCFCAVLWLALGFAFGNLGEAVEGRRATIDRRDIIDDRLKGLRADLVKADERRKQCESEGPCPLAKDRKGRLAEVGRLTALATGIKAEIEKYEVARNKIPPIVVADPQIAGGVNAIRRAGYNIDAADARAGFDISLSLMLLLLPSALGRGAISLVRD